MTSQLKTALLLALLTGIILVLGQAMGGKTGLIIAFGLALIMNLGSYWYSDKIVLKIYKARIGNAPSVTPGQIRTDGKKELSIACADGWLHIEQLQLAGKKRMSTEELLRGFKSITSYRAR